MLRSAFTAFIVVFVGFAILQIPGRPETVPLPSAEAARPSYDILPLPSSGGCPGGVCPVPARAAEVVRSVLEVTAAPVVRVAAPVIRTVAPVVSANHWTYPGEIRSHLAASHGVNANGMTRAQAEALHDGLHNGGASHAVSYRPVAMVATAPVRYVASRQPVRRVASMPVRLLQSQPVRSFARRIFCR